MTPESSDPPSEGSSARNELEIQFFGLQRSGNHAVLSWIFRQFDEPACFFNNVKKFEDPFLNFRSVRLPNTIPVRPGPAGTLSFEKEQRAKAVARLEALRSKQKRLLAYSYENFPLRQLQKRELIDQKEVKVGESATIRRVLLIRDFYNWIASRMRLLENRERAISRREGIDRLVSEWIAYAKEYTGKTAFMQGEQIVRISYNRWIEDESYRAQLLEELHAPMKDNTIEYVPDVGGGSSFDGVAASDSIRVAASERWRYLLRDDFIDILQPVRDRQKQIEFYNQEIFGLRSPL